MVEGGVHTVLAIQRTEAVRYAKAFPIAISMACLSISATAQVVPVPSDPRARYLVVEIKENRRGFLEVLSQRDGPSGRSYALREVDCRRRTFRYLGDSDSLSEALAAPGRARPGNEMGGLVNGSISDVISKFACAAGVRG